MERDFFFGAATAAYQIEGAPFEDGKTASIWDVFAHTKGKIANDENADVACDHYHRCEEDVRLIAGLGVDYYRFSVSWPRIFPQKSVYNPKGMDFYKRLIAALKERGVKAAVTLYHWDLPQWCQDEGGWANRAVVGYFAEYARKCFEELGDKCDMWMTLNEPMAFVDLGYGQGVHAPGISDTKSSLAAWHHAALSHGTAIRIYRETGLEAPIGIALNTQCLMPCDPDSPLDRRAAEFANEAFNGWYLGPLFKGRYPEAGKKLYLSVPDAFSFIRDGDMEIIGEPMDFVGLNYYGEQFLRFTEEDGNGIVRYETVQDTDHPKTMLGWNITPEGIINLSRYMRGFTDLPIVITENGSAWRDTVAPDGGVRDGARVDYLKRHLEAVCEANRLGLDIRGYFTWSLMDNFEWSLGFEPRFGIVRVDYATGERTPKDSYYFYRDYIADFKSRRGSEK